MVGISIDLYTICKEKMLTADMTDYMLEKDVLVSFSHSRLVENFTTFETEYTRS